MKKWCVVKFIHESVYMVTAFKYFEGSLTECKRYVDNKNSDQYGVIENFDGDEMNADYAQVIYPEPL